MIEALDPLNPAVIDRPKGRYTVELFDAESGVLVETVQTENYISPVYAQSIAGLQHTSQWMNAMLASDSAVYRSDAFASSSQNLLTGLLAASRLWNPFGVPALPTDAMILTDDDTAEDTTQHWLRGNMIAYGSRWKATVAASGARGQINEAECLISDVGQTSTTVWDFTTSQGNGTFQTLGIGSLENHDTTTHKRYWTAAGPRCIVLNTRMPPTGPILGYIASSNSSLYDDGTNCFFVANDSTLTTGNVMVYSVPSADIWAAAAHPTEPFAQLCSAGAPTLVCDSGINFQPNPSSNNNNSGPQAGGDIPIIKLTGGDFIIAWQGLNFGSSIGSGGRTVTIRRFTSSGTLVWSTLPCPVGDANGNGFHVSLAYDGTDVYVIYSAGDAGENFYRINPATGALSATIALPTDVNVNEGANVGIAWDGTNLLVSTNQGIIKVTTAGVPVSPFNYGTPFAPIGTSTAIAPWPTTAGVFGALGRGRSGVNCAQVGSNQDGAIQTTATTATVIGEMNQLSTSTAWTPTRRGMTLHDGKMWVLLISAADADFAPGGPAVLVAITGANMFSRARLAAPVTKDSTQNMKITYELTWPAQDPATWPSHRAL